MVAVNHCTKIINGIEVFYREAGDPQNPKLLLPHGYPCSSYQFRRLMACLADSWYLVAPDFPGFGYSQNPRLGASEYHFQYFAEFLAAFADALGMKRYALWLHDYGSQIGLRHAIAHPDRIAALIIQNGDIYEDALGPKYSAIKKYWAEPTSANRKNLENAVSEKGFRAEFIGEVSDDIAQRVAPDLWKLHWPLMDTPQRREGAVALMERLEENLNWFPRYQKYLRVHRPPTLILWGPQDGYMPEPAARAYLRDLPAADLHVLDDAGHWLLETHFEAALPLVRSFLHREMPPAAPHRETSQIKGARE